MALVGCNCNENDDWVDLGLPSGRQWATRNVGASSPTDYGNYYAWGETTPKSVYDWSTYRYCVHNESNGCYGSRCLTKYCTDSYHGYNGFTDGLTILQPGDDAATANYGGRTPTTAEWEELYNNTTSRWMTVNGVNGRCFTGPNGNSLFLPAAGGRSDSSLYDGGSRGYYWSSSLRTDNPAFACFCVFRPEVSMGYGWGHDIRADGCTFRAVRQP
ncbi:MAG: hypothetical protein J6X88_11560 [Bacteroidales bacterium]|nr:hypothetical protein [Bacteroidales bacterium]